MFCNSKSNQIKKNKKTHTWHGTTKHKKQTKKKCTIVFCSAVPVTYSRTPSTDWAKFAELILKGAYCGTLSAAAILSKQKKKNERIDVYLTCLGGGAFGNRSHWIQNAIQYAINQHLQYPLNVQLVHYGYIPANYHQIKVPKNQK